MFLAMRFLHSGKITLCGKGYSQDCVQKIHKPSDNDISK